MSVYETEAILDALREYDNAFLDTCFTMSSAAPESGDFGPDSVPDEVFEAFADRIKYGSDFPTIPYRAEREGLLARERSEEATTELFRNATDRFLGVGD